MFIGHADIGAALIIILLVIGGLVLWYFAANAKPEEADPRYRRDSRLTPDNPEWREIAEALCESPAETAFLAAMIDAYGLIPDGGSLRHTETRLDFQVGQGRYRADFLVNEWLVVEVDGAAYHGSPQQQARDRLRDEYFIGLGYAVLRLPAKLVFQIPREAIRQVRERLSQGRPIVVPEPRPKPNLLAILSKTASDLGDGMAKLNEYVSRQRAINDALKEQRAVLDDARLVHGLAVDWVRRKAKIDAVCDAKERREDYDRHHARLSAALLQGKAATIPAMPPARASANRTMQKPERNENPEYDCAISDAYGHILADYNKLITAIKAQMDADPDTRSIVLKMLTDLGSLGLAAEFTCHTSHHTPR